MQQVSESTTSLLTNDNGSKSLLTTTLIDVCSAESCDQCVSIDGCRWCDNRCVDRPCNAVGDGKFCPTTSTATGEWRQWQADGDEAMFRLRWRVSNKRIYMELSANTDGYLAVGWSKGDVAHQDTDCVVVWLDDELGARAIDAYSSFELVQPQTDAAQMQMYVW